MPSKSFLLTNYIKIANSCNAPWMKSKPLLPLDKQIISSCTMKCSKPATTIISFMSFAMEVPSCKCSLKNIIFNKKEPLISSNNFWKLLKYSIDSISCIETSNQKIYSSLTAKSNSVILASVRDLGLRRISQKLCLGLPFIWHLKF